MATATAKHWSFNPDASHTVVVQQLPSGLWLGTMCLKLNLDPTGSNDRQGTFPTVEEALDFVGWPHDIVGIPEPLR